MPREATGELRCLADGFAARITIQGRDRRDFVLPTCATEPDALERCKALASMASRMRRAGHASEILRLLEKEFPDYLARKRSARRDLQNMKHVPAEYLDMPLRLWTSETYQAVMRQLP